MNCAEFQNLVEDLAREQSHDDAVLSAALAHAESCRACDELWREAERLTEGLRALALEEKQEVAPRKIETALLSALRRRQAPVIRARRAGAWLAATAAGLAAAALLVVFRVGDQTNVSPAPAAAPLSAPLESAPPTPRALWAEVAGEDLAGELADEFIPLTASFDPSWLQGGAIVRVVLSRPALASLGVPVNFGGNGEMVADMVVSYDGTPEALRVVDWRVSDGR
jgi:hypothetical protein